MGNSCGYFGQNGSTPHWPSTIAYRCLRPNKQANRDSKPLNTKGLTGELLGLEVARNLAGTLHILNALGCI
jgi:hypothetical protein